MDEHDIRIAATSEVERLTGAEGDDAYLDTGFALEDRQDVSE